MTKDPRASSAKGMPRFAGRATLTMGEGALGANVNLRVAVLLGRSAAAAGT